MKHFLFKLIPPRPTFMADMTPVEAKIMQEHLAYWRSLLDRNVAVVFGPVLDPAGAYGVAVVRSAGESQVRALATEDPAIKAQAGFRFEIHPMASAVYRA
jgi:hypothetical protein